MPHFLMCWTCSGTAESAQTGSSGEDSPMKRLATTSGSRASQEANPSIKIDGDSTSTGRSLGSATLAHHASLNWVIAFDHLVCDPAVELACLLHPCSACDVQTSGKFCSQQPVLCVKSCSQLLTHPSMQHCISQCTLKDFSRRLCLNSGLALCNSLPCGPWDGSQLCFAMTRPPLVTFGCINHRACRC